MQDVKLKATNEIGINKNSKTQTAVWQLSPRGRGWELVKTKGVKYMEMEEGVTLGDRCIMQYTDDVSQNGTLGTYIILLTNVTQ